MLRLTPLLLLLFVGCQRPVAAVLTYAPAPVAAGQSSNRITFDDMSRAVDAIQERLCDRSIPCRVSWDSSLQVSIGVFDDSAALAQKIDRLVCMPGTFQLRIAANSFDHSELIDKAKETDDQLVYDDQGKVLGWWVPINRDKDNDLSTESDVITRESDRDGHTVLELLVVDDPYEIDGSMMIRAARGVDQTGRPSIDFQFSAAGGRLLEALTMENLPDSSTGQMRRLAIVVDGHVLSAPAIRCAIRDRAEITGGFTAEEVRDLVYALTMPVRLIRVGDGDSIDH